MEVSQIQRRCNQQPRELNTSGRHIEQAEVLGPRRKWSLRGRAEVEQSLVATLSDDPHGNKSGLMQSSRTNHNLTKGADLLLQCSSRLHHEFTELRLDGPPKLEQLPLSVEHGVSSGV